MLRFILNTGIRIRAFMRVWMPTNVVLDTLRTKRGLMWSLPAPLLAVAYFAVAYWCTALIADGAPEWLYLLFLLCIYNGFKFLFHAPLIFARILKARREERCSSPTGHEALPSDEHGPTHIGRTSAAPKA